MAHPDGRIAMALDASGRGKRRENPRVDVMAVIFDVPRPDAKRR